METKADLSLVSTNQLMSLTGKSFRVIKKTLAVLDPVKQTGTAILYSSIAALELIYSVQREAMDAQAEGGLLNPFQEKARLDKHRADKVELEVGVLRGKLLHADKVKASWEKVFGIFRARILNIPGKISPRVAAAKGLREVEEIIKKECHEALTELSKGTDEHGKPRK